MKRPDIPARGLVLAAIKLDIRKRQVRYPRMEIDLHTMTGGDRGIERSWPRVRGIGGWLGGGGEEEGTKSNSPPGTDDKALVSETKNRSGNVHSSWIFCRR